MPKRRALGGPPIRSGLPRLVTPNTEIVNQFGTREDKSGSTARAEGVT